MVGTGVPAGPSNITPLTAHWHHIAFFVSLCLCGSFLFFPGVSLPSEIPSLHITPAIKVRLPDADGPIVCASVMTHLGRGSSPVRDQAKALLLNHLRGELLPRTEPRLERSPDPGAVSLGTDSLGKPTLSGEGSQCLSISFATCEGVLWAALAHGRVSVGLDVTSPRQFSGPYPFLRVFGASEWEIALGLVSGRSLDAAALLWGAKEAAVKALGVGFHMQDPSEITVSNARSRDEGTLLTLSVGRSDRPHNQPGLHALTRDPAGGVSDEAGYLSGVRPLSVFWQDLGQTHMEIAVVRAVPGG